MPKLKAIPMHLLRGVAPGTWVAISEDQEAVIATGESVEEILAKAKKEGVENPFIFRIPDLIPFYL
jgi:hypothetical protein